MPLLNMFKRRDSEILDNKNIPLHIAIIMDGNGRWAKKRGLPRKFGHKQGANTLKNISFFCNDIGIKHLTVYAFSTENWKRPQEEVDALMSLLLDYLKNIEKYFEDRDIRINVIGEVTKFSTDIQNEIIRVHEITKNNKGLFLNIALNYGSRYEIINAVRKIAIQIKNDELNVNDIEEDTLNKALYTCNMPDPDLIIRTAGEKRLSNFLLWQAAYSELWMTDVLWPDFNKTQLIKAIKDYQLRERKFGGI